MTGPSLSQIPRLTSPFFDLALDPIRPRFEKLAIDGLGKGRYGDGACLPSEEPESTLKLTWVNPSMAVYADSKGYAAWTVSLKGRILTLRSNFVQGSPVNRPFELRFRQKANHATLLGLMAPDSRAVQLPCVLHLPDQGSIRIKGQGALPYDARRYVKPEPYVSIAFPAATVGQKKVSYTLDATCIFPNWKGADGPLFDGFKRGYLNIFQLNPRFRMLCNNASSDAVPFTVYMLAEVAKKAPELVPGLRAMDLVKATVDRYLAGEKGYGLRGYGSTGSDADIVGWATPYDSLDTYPSLLIAACEVAKAERDTTWAKASFATISSWAKEMMAGDRDGNGLVEYPRTGNFGDRPVPSNRPSNWWDCINFGHEDAYANALAYRASVLLAELARRLGHKDEAASATAFAVKLKASYHATFLNPKTGLLAGWRSKDGQRHDYAFPFVQGIAVAYGLLTPEQGNKAMDVLLAKMKAVGFNRFDLGLPGNLIPVPKGDYVKHDWAGAIGVGEPSLDDGSDAFQIYENGGATGCYAFFTVRALYQLGRIEDARRVFLPMLQGYAEGNFMGFGPNGQSKDWRAWDGTCHGYEGLLVDAFMTLLCVEDELMSRLIGVPKLNERP
ncbi:MAG: hypothetical protein HZC36_15910 [Armatimonadetes bacterium]|nr:hypothetical protein [Armatimonadota bacterium]